MSYNEKKVSIEMGHGQAPIELSTGKLAKQADGSVVVPEVLRKYMGCDIIKA